MTKRPEAPHRRNDTTTAAPAANGDRRRLGAELAVAALAAVIGFVAVYLTIGRPGKLVAGTPSTSVVAAKVEAVSPGGSTAGGGPLNQGQMTAFVFKKAPEPLPEVAFTDAAGVPLTLATFKGKTVLLNLWATWCAPCRKEMPDLDRLQKELGSDRFQVVALSVDRQGAEAAQKFLDSIKIENLKLYIDKTARAASTLRAIGMPTTILIDPEGREVGRLVGPAEWHSADAKRLIEASLK